MRLNCRSAARRASSSSIDGLEVVVLEVKRPPPCSGIAALEHDLRLHAGVAFRTSAPPVVTANSAGLSTS
jgi:hypothetical protein